MGEFKNNIPAVRHLVFATNNEYKVTEIRAALGSSFKISSLKEAGILIDIPEPHNTLEENAREKSSTILALTGQDCFAEDTGLEVYALGGEPGVKSARYAGSEKSFEKNIEKLLLKLDNHSNRMARFRTVISLQWQGQEHQFEGITEGEIIRTPKGKGGFGYDPVFIPAGENRTFAEMDLDEKNQLSHRRKALDLMVAFLQK